MKNTYIDKLRVLAVQDSSIGDLVSDSVIKSSFDFSNCSVSISTVAIVVIVDFVVIAVIVVIVVFRSRQ